jgi:uncharacterized membrane protein
MQTERGLERLVGFTDAVVAIAITLLVLPLVESARDVHTSVADFLSSNTTSLFTFALSFVVIAGFWRVQHRRFESVTGYNPPLVWATMLWLFAIVFLPLPTELLGGAVDDDRGAHALYIGTMVLSMVAGVLQAWVIRWRALTEPARLRSWRGILTAWSLHHTRTGCTGCHPRRGSRCRPS